MDAVRACGGCRYFNNRGKAVELFYHGERDWNAITFGDRYRNDERATTSTYVISSNFKC